MVVSSVVTRFGCGSSGCVLRLCAVCCAFVIVLLCLWCICGCGFVAVCCVVGVGCLWM